MGGQPPSRVRIPPSPPTCSGSRTGGTPRRAARIRSRRSLRRWRSAATWSRSTCGAVATACSCSTTTTPTGPARPLLVDALRLIAETSSAGANLDVKQSETGPAIVDGGARRRHARPHHLHRRRLGGAGAHPRRPSRASASASRCRVADRRCRGSSGSSASPWRASQMATAIPGLMERYGADLVTVFHRLVDRRVVAAVHDQGGEIWTWTVDNPRELAPAGASSASTASARTARPATASADRARHESPATGPFGPCATTSCVR